MRNIALGMAAGFCILLASAEGASLGYKAGIDKGQMMRPQQVVCFVDDRNQIHHIENGQIMRGCPDILHFRENETAKEPSNDSNRPSGT